MKKLAMILLTLLLLLCASTALAWECPGCGRGNGGNFCTECGTRKPASNVCTACDTDHGDKMYTFCPNCGTRMGMPAATATPICNTPLPAAAFEITGISRNADGTHTISWTDSGNGPYRVRYAVKLSDDYAADLASPLNAGLYRATQDYEATSYILKSLVPGQDYWISVVDSAGQEARMAYDAPALTAFSNFSTQLTVKPRIRQGEDVSELPSFVADEISTSGDAECGLYIQLDYETLAADQNVWMLVALTDPNGMLITLDKGMFSFPAGEGYYRYWEFFSLDWYFGQVEGQYGTIPVGDYTLWMYLNGALANQADFTVREEAEDCGISITRLTPNGDGTVHISWTDSLNRGPYTVNYVQMLSSSFEDDKNSPNGVGEWMDEENVSGYSCTMDCLIPGVDYWVIVRDSTGWGTYKTYAAPDVPDFDEFDCELSYKLKTRVGDKTTDVKTFSAAQITQGAKEHGGYLKISHPRLARDRDYLMQLAITTPNGAIITENVHDIHLESGGSRYYYWSFYSLDWYFERVLANLGYVPVGEYTIDVYFDGLYTCSTTFTVKE